MSGMQPVVRERSSIASSHGISLVELMVGIVTSVLVAGSALSMTVHNERTRKIDEEKQLALVAAKNNLEELRSLPIAQLPSMHDVGFDVPDHHGKDGGLAPRDGDPDDLPGRFEVLIDHQSGTETLYLVRAHVEWRGTQGEQKLRFETLIKGRR